MKFSTTNRELRRALTLLQPITDNAEGFPLLMGVFLEVRDGVVTATATDRYRIMFTALETVPWKDDELQDGEFVVDLRTFQRALRIVTVQKRRMDDVVHVYRTESGRLAIQLPGGLDVTLQPTEGDYPKVWELAKRFMPTEKVRVNPVNPAYARDLMPVTPHGTSQIASSVGDKGYLIVATDNTYGVLVPLRGEDTTLKTPAFMESRLTGKSA